jgi:hypothetical protein
LQPWLLKFTEIIEVRVRKTLLEDRGLCRELYREGDILHHGSFPWEVRCRESIQRKRSNWHMGYIIDGYQRCKLLFHEASTATKGHPIQALEGISMIVQQQLFSVNGI